jgi:YesN/AraC family two-component response regulator
MTKVLIIEDEAQTREVFLECLKTEGFEAIEAKNGRIGVQKAREHLPDIVICDIAMPELDGYGVLKALRENPTTAITPFIFLTGKDTRSELRQGMERGADDYLTKPFSPRELIGAIANQLEKRKILKQWFPLKSQQVESPVFEESTDCYSRFCSRPHLQKVFNFIEAHYHETISLRDVAKEVGFSPGYLTELVKRLTGETVNRWIVKRRLSAACALLLETTDSIESIAIKVGYLSPGHFFNQFRQQYKATPQTWRKMNCH